MQHMLVFPRMVPLIALALLAGCGGAPSSGGATGEAAAVAPLPATLPVVGDGFPAAGAPCRRIGESPATVDFLDDSASLVGCRDPKDAAALGGKVLAVVDGVTLVSVPAGNAGPAAVPGDGDGQGDAKVAGTDYDATAEVRCSGYRKHPAGLCPAGIRRRGENGWSAIDVTWPAGGRRTLFFDASGKLVSADTSQADGSARYQPEGVRQGDTTVVTIGPERYEIPDAFVQGD